MQSSLLNTQFKIIKHVSLIFLVMAITACSKTPDQNNQKESSDPVKQAQTTSGAVENKTADPAQTEDESESDDNAIPDSDIYVAALQFRPGVFELGAPVNITNNPGYDNQPFFLPDNNTILFTSRRGKAPQNEQSDIYAYQINSKQTIQMTQTPESEYSPTLTPSGEGISVVRVEMDSMQRLWEFPIQGGMATNENFEVVFPEVNLVGYHAWVDADNAMVFLVDPDPEGDNHTLEKASRIKSKTQKVATKIGRSLVMQPENKALSFIDKSNDKKWLVKRYDIQRNLAVEMLPAVPGSEDVAWLDANHLIMAKGQNIYINTTDRKYGDNWQIVAANATNNINGEISRLAVSPDQKWLAMVVTQASSK